VTANEYFSRKQLREWIRQLHWKIYTPRGEGMLALAYCPDHNNAPKGPTP
jgi:LPS sulfotransferase NodH